MNKTPESIAGLCATNFFQQSFDHVDHLEGSFVISDMIYRGKPSEPWANKLNIAQILTGKIELMCLLSFEICVKKVV